MNLDAMNQSFERILFFPFFFLIIIFIVIFFAIGIFLCIWIYKDAKSRGMDGTLWVIIILIANIIGLIIYLVVREDKKKESIPREGTRYCVYCGKNVSLDAKFCGTCGKQINSKEIN
jgi:ABC-type transport system involved in multi-copper enzyme maturation permease subunit